MTKSALQLWQEFARRTLLDLPVEWRRDRKGVVTGWCTLPDASLLLPLGEAVAAANGRLSMITAYLTEEGKRSGVREIAYHFDLDGTTLTITIRLALEGARVPSLTPVFRNADWNERELMELYAIAVDGHPDPRPLFVDRSAGTAVFERLVPYSTFTNGTGSSTLWDRIMAARAAQEGK